MILGKWLNGSIGYLRASFRKDASAQSVMIYSMLLLCTRD